MKIVNLSDLKSSHLVVEWLIYVWNWKHSLIKLLMKNDTTIVLKISTGGDSKHEEIIEKLKKSLFWEMWWQQSNRGGHYIFEIDYSRVGFKTVSQLAKELNISRQYIHHNKHKYEWIHLSTKKNLIRKK